MTRKREELLRIFAPAVRKILERASMDFEKLQEIRLRSLRPLMVIYGGEEWAVTPRGTFVKDIGSAYYITEQDMKDTLLIVSSYSLYAYEDEVKQGFLTISGGHRIGIAGRTVMEQGKIKSFKYISCINVRLAHQIIGCADKILPYVFDENKLCNCLIISPPGCGKTTLLRDMIRQLSNGSGRFAGNTVGIVDERAEIGGCYMGIPQNDVGIRTDILDCCPKAEGMMMLIRSMAPDIVALDEIGDDKETNAIEAVIHCGCKLIATVHGSSMEDIRKKPLLDKLLGEHLFDRCILLKGCRSSGALEAVFDGEGNILYRAKE